MAIFAMYGMSCIVMVMIRAECAIGLNLLCFCLGCLEVRGKQVTSVGWSAFT